MKIITLERTPNGAAAFSGQAASTRGRRYIFFADHDGSAAVFRDQGAGFIQIKPDSPPALMLAVRRAIESMAVQS